MSRDFGRVVSLSNAYRFCDFRNLSSVSHSFLRSAPSSGAWLRSQRRQTAGSGTTTNKADEELIDRSEGDVNLSSVRGRWQDSNLSASTRKLLDEDQKYFLHQAVSTPCLNAAQGVRGINIEEYATGREIMDFHGNSVHQVGYGNPEVIAAITQQLQTLSFCPRRYTNEPAVALAKKLTELAPGQLNRVLFCPGGTSAVGIGLKLARMYTGKHRTLSFWESFHGASLDCISIGGEAIFRKNVGPLLPGSMHVPPPDEYRCILNGGEMGVADLIEYTLEQEAGEIGALIAEPIRWTPYIPSKEFWVRVKASCEKHGALLIFDEIPNSLGRTGTFFTCENYVTPDILCIGKGLGGGVLPFAAVIADEKLNECGKHAALGHYTHEKSPVLCATASATIAYIEKHKLSGHALALGDYALARMRTMMSKYTLIGDVRGKGLLLGMELVKSRETKERAFEEAEVIMYKSLTKGLSYKLTMGNIVTLCPPLIITKEQLDRALDILEECLQEVAAGDMSV